MKTVGPILAVLIAAYTLWGAGSWATGGDLVPPDDPTQNISYWKSYVIGAQQDDLAAKSHAVFEVLLRAWDSSRLAPSLYIVAPSSGPWAASLADGSILLTRSALDIIMGFGQERGEHLLAFVLAHELAHQRADDLWHMRFFRFIENQQPEVKTQMLRQWHLSRDLLEDIAQKEAQADHDGLIMMASVGYDPYQILDKKDFFTAWIENTWQGACELDGNDAAMAKACAEARQRALRTRIQLRSVATQAMLYELGVQAFVAGNYSQARQYFTSYGHSFINRSILEAVGMTYFSEALAIHRHLNDQQALNVPAFYYPVLLDVSALPFPDMREDAPLKRSALEALIDQELRIMRTKLGRGIEHFEKAVRLAPNHAKAYLMLACSYLMDGNTYMARGIVQGKYIPRFGADNASHLILAMTLAVEGRYGQARQRFAEIIADIDKFPAPASIPKDLLLYATFHNSAALADYLEQDARAQMLWRDLAEHAKSSGNGLLFRVALNHLNVSSPAIASLERAPTIAGFRIGDQLALISEGQTSYNADDLWIEGEPFRVLRFDDGSRFVVGADSRIVSAWQNFGQAELNSSIHIGDKADRPIKSMGIPDRRLHLISGEYLAYDDYGVAIHIENRKIAGWFLYNHSLLD